MSEASEIEKTLINGLWEFKSDQDRRDVCLCPNCLVERIGPFAKPHADWCAIGRRAGIAEPEKVN